MGKQKIADTLARAGLHLASTTVQRILKEKPVDAPEPSDEPGNRIVAKGPDHTWHADLTAVPLSGGFWMNWMPNALRQRWPVCFWLLVTVDHFSRRSPGFAVFQHRPTSEEVTAALDRIMLESNSTPKHLIVDQGREFKCEHFENAWCKERSILPRFGAIGMHGSIAVVERLNRTAKELLRQIVLPEEQSQFEREVSLVLRWYNTHRPHETLGGKTPDEVHFDLPPANEQPRLEPRKRWPRGSPCAKPQVDVDGQPGDPIHIGIDFLEGRRHLPILNARRVA